MADHTGFLAAAAHPRVSGENAKATIQEIKYTGSSPRERGKHDSITPLLHELGLIPA